MKATLEFKNEDDFKLAIYGKHFYHAINAHLSYLRDIMKYNDLSEQELAIYEKIRNDFLDTIEHTTNICDIQSFVP